MADKLLSTIAGGGGSDGGVTKFYSGAQQISSGVSGDILTLTPPAGQRVRLVSLNSNAGGNEPGITISVGAVDVITSLNLIQNAGAASNGNFVINGGTRTSGAPNGLDSLLGEIDEVIVVKKDAGSTANIINYAYAFGV